MNKNTGRWWFTKPHPFVTKVDRWKVRYHNGYIIDRRIFILFMLFTISFTIYGMSRYDFDFSQKVWLSCPGYAPCDNPLYDKCDEWYCKQKTLPAGFEYGERPDAFFENFPLYVALVGIIAVVANHVIHNRKFEFKED